MILKFDDTNIENIKNSAMLKKEVQENALELISYYAKNILINKPQDDFAYLSLPEKADNILVTFQETLDCRDIDSRMLSLYNCEKKEPHYKDFINHFIHEIGGLSNEFKIKWDNVSDIEKFYAIQFKKEMTEERFNELESTLQDMRYNSLKYNIEMLSFFFININHAFVEKGVHKMSIDFENKNIICKDQEDREINNPIDLSFVDTLLKLDSISNGVLRLKYLQKEFVYSQFEAFCSINLRIKDDVKDMINANYEKNILFSQLPISMERTIKRSPRI